MLVIVALPITAAVVAQSVVMVLPFYCHHDWATIVMVLLLLMIPKQHHNRTNCFAVRLAQAIILACGDLPGSKKWPGPYGTSTQQ